MLSHPLNKMLIPLPHQKAVTSVLCFGRVIAPTQCINQLRKRQHRPAVGQFIPDLVISSGTINGAQDHDVCFVLDLPAAVAWRTVYISDDGVVWIDGIDFPRHSANKLLILTDIPNDRPSKVGDSMRSIITFVVRACAIEGIASKITQTPAENANFMLSSHNFSKRHCRHATPPNLREQDNQFANCLPRSRLTANLARFLIRRC